MGLLRLILLSILVYWGYHIVKKLIISVSSKKTESFVKRDTPANVPPPYDPNQIEDINFREIKDDKDKDIDSEDAKDKKDPE